MREIKFRGKSITSGKWFYGSLINDKDRRWIYIQEKHWNLGVFDNFDVDPETVGQYTGLKDKNGKEIYEGDILQDKELPTVKIQVQYNDQKGMFEDKIDGFSLWDSMKNYDFEVVGNIHENPELLEVAE
ncbi:YopX family protein [Pseudobacillus badius]|uniref:YopX family protein n=1 Tax=Bacillus badius TaxID=1455 RepID=UPI0007B31CAE|nr:YopX family protein [Bacillus badius]KZR60416.1 hypothetical protein A3781_09600 [Bacillus badius]